MYAQHRVEDGAGGDPLPDGARTEAAQQAERQSPSRRAMAARDDGEPAARRREDDVAGSQDAGLAAGRVPVRNSDDQLRQTTQGEDRLVVSRHAGILIAAAPPGLHDDDSQGAAPRDAGLQRDWQRLAGVQAEPCDAAIALEGEERPQRRRLLRAERRQAHGRAQPLARHGSRRSEAPTQPAAHGLNQTSGGSTVNK